MKVKDVSQEMPWSVSVWMVVVFTLAGWILNIVSFSAPFWNKSKPVHWGLWQICDDITVCKGLSNETLTGLMQIGRVILAISFLSYIVLIVLVAVYLFGKKDFRLLSAAAATSFLTLLGLFLGAILWISAANTTLSYCYYICYASAFLAAVSGGVILHVRRQERLRTLYLQQLQGENLPTDV